jgi:putative transposase
MKNVITFYELMFNACRVWRDLLADGVECGLHRIERLMRLQALRARPRRRRLPKDEGDRQVAHVPTNLLDRQFVAERPNQKWIADFTYIWTGEGWLYVAAVIDLFSRRVVGWSMSATMTAQLVADALVMAVWHPKWSAAAGQFVREPLLGEESAARRGHRVKSHH